MFNHSRVPAAHRSGAQDGSPSTHSSTHTHTPTTTHRHTRNSTTPQPLMSLITQPITNRPTRFTPQQQYTSPVINQAPDPETRETSKLYFKFIQATHHKHIMDTAIITGKFPPGMLRQVTRLTDFIKPSTPTPETRTKIHNNTTLWMHNTITILSEHYSNTLSAIDTSTYNPIAFQIATGWARKRYGDRLTTGTIQATEVHLQSTTEKQPSQQHSHQPRQRTSILPTIPEEQYPPLPKPVNSSTLSLYLGPRPTITEEITQMTPPTGTPTQPHQVTAGTQTTPPIKTNTPQASYIPSPYPVYKPAKTTNPTTHKPIRTGPIRPPPTTAPTPASRNPDPDITPPAPATSTPHPQRTRKVTWGPLPTAEDTYPGTPHTPISPISPPTPPMFKPRQPPTTSQTAAQVHHPTRHFYRNSELQTVTLNTRSNVSVHITDSILTSSPLTEPEGSRAEQVRQQTPKNNTLAGRDMMTGSNKVDSDQHPIPSEPSPAPTRETVLSGLPASGAGPTPTSPTTPNNNHLSPPCQTSSPIPSLPSNLTTPTQPPSIPPSPLPSSTPSPSPSPPHPPSPPPHSPQDTPTISEPAANSNINRIPAHPYPNIQLDSYPGANTYHFTKVMEKTPVNHHVKILIISIGTNNKDQDARQTSIKQLKTVFRLAGSTFPNADIYFPIINFSPQLTTTQKSNLTLINNVMATHFPILLEIPHDTFTTEKDNIHWTPFTASRIFENWLRQLNLP
ncbi:mucin-2-like [Centropristis striata]|uniref:mucin-2-like n=1 Tax=Centropristis striata TaxID=184440 RepID=UPI0027E1123B|nr:mucin-2-like [Centropristis striata]